MRYALVYSGVMIAVMVIVVAWLSAKALHSRSSWKKFEQKCREKAEREAGETVSHVRSGGGDTIVETSGEVLIVPGRQHDDRRTR